MDLATSPTLKPVRQKVKTTEANPETAVTEIKLGFEIDPTKVYIFEALQKSNQPRWENLGATAKAFDPVYKRYRELRYFALAESIFADEQDDSFDEQQTVPLGFYNNVLYANGQDIRLMEYLFNHPLYDGSPFRVANRPALFTLADKEVQEEIKAKRHEKELLALQTIKEAPIDDLKPVARNIFGITEEGDKAIVNALNEMVKRPKQGSDKTTNAEKLLDNIGNLKLLRTYHIQIAVDRGIISTDLNKMQVRFIDGNVFICNLNTRNPIKELADYSFTPDGQKFYTTLRQKV